MKLALLLTASLFGTLATVGCAPKPTKEQCREACHNNAELHFWKGFEGAIDNLPEDRKPAARKKGKQEWEKGLKADMGKKNDECVTSCVQGGRKSQVDCIIKAKSVPEVEKCTKQ